MADLLQPLARHLRREEVSEILVNGDGRIWIEANGEMHREHILISRYFLEEAAVNIARQYGDDVSSTRPILDARLECGSRVAITYPPCSVGGPTIAIRKFQRKLFSMDELMRIGSVTDDQRRVLDDAIRARENVLISGSTSTGKTTAVNCCANLIPPDQRLAIIEDTAELQIDNLPNVIRFEARKAFVDLNDRHVPAVTIRELVIAVLRQRPDRIIVGEVRGGEAFDLLRALNTGHGGSFSTIHANGPQEALEWLAALALLGAPERMTETLMARQVFRAFQFVVHLERVQAQRRVSSISQIEKYDAASGEFVVRKVA